MIGWLDIPPLLAYFSGDFLSMINSLLPPGIQVAHKIKIYNSSVDLLEYKKILFRNAFLVALAAGFFTILEIIEFVCYALQIISRNSINV